MAGWDLHPARLLMPEWFADPLRVVVVSAALALAFAVCFKLWRDRDFLRSVTRSRYFIFRNAGVVAATAYLCDTEIQRLGEPGTARLVVAVFTELCFLLAVLGPTWEPQVDLVHDTSDQPVRMTVFALLVATVAIAISQVVLQVQGQQRQDRLNALGTAVCQQGARQLDALRSWIAANERLDVASDPPAIARARAQAYQAYLRDLGPLQLSCDDQEGP